MKFLSDNFLTLVLAFVLSISSIQSFAASADECVDMDSNMHVQMMHDNVEKIQTSDLADCCNQDACSSTHCTGVTAALNYSTIYKVNDVLSTTSPIPNVILISFYYSTLYRPPKV